MARLKEVKPVFPAIALGGKIRTIKYDLNAFAEMEAKFGSVDAAMRELQGGSMKSLKIILWIGLIHEEAILDDFGDVVGYKITPYQVGSWIAPSKIREVSEKINEAIQIGMPDIDDIPGAEEKLAELGFRLDENKQIVPIDGEVKNA
jgi:hypothetical protein